MPNDDYAVISYADGLVIDPATGEIVEAPPLAGDKLAYVTHTRHGGKATARQWDRAIGGWDAYLKRQLEDARQNAVLVEIGGYRLALSSRYQRRTKYRSDVLVRAIQEAAGAAADYAAEAGNAADPLAELIGDLAELVSMATGFRAEDVRRLAADRRPARWLALAAEPYTTEPWIETAEVLAPAPLR